MSAELQCIKDLKPGDIFFFDPSACKQEGKPYALIELDPVCLIIELDTSDKFYRACIFGQSALVKYSGRSLSLNLLENYTEIARQCYRQSR